MKKAKSIEELDFCVNKAQLASIMLQAKNSYFVWSRGTGKSFIVGKYVDELVRKFPRSVTTLSQATYGQALTKTLPSTFKALEMMGYRRYDPGSRTGDYVVCKTPPDGFARPYEHILSFEHCITFANGSVLYILSQDGSARGPNADFNITDEALTLDKAKFDEEAAPTNRGNETIWGKASRRPQMMHHGNLFVSSAPYTMEQKWLLEPAAYYEEEKGVNLIDRWNGIVRMQMQLIEAQMKGDVVLFREIWNECVRLRRTIRPFVSKDKTLFMLASIFDNIQNVGMSYIINEYKIMDKMRFMVEILNYIIDKIDNCYYHFGDHSKYYDVSSSFVTDFADNTDYDFGQLSRTDSRFDGDCRSNAPIELCFDWGTRASFVEVAQTGNYDFATNTSYINRVVDNTINEFYVKRDEVDDVEVHALVDKFCYYYRYHGCKIVDFFRDRYGDVRHPNSKKTYNEMAIDRLKKNGWQVRQHTHGGIEPPQHDKYLLWSAICAEKDQRLPLKRFNASKCKHIIISMNNTRLKESQGKFAKDKSSERNNSIDPLDATHFGDVVDKRVWTKYNKLLKRGGLFVDIHA